MATPKKSKKPIAKPAAAKKKTPPSPPKRAAKSTAKAKPKAPSLSAAQKQATLKPREGAHALIEQIVRAWGSEKALRVPGLSPGRLTRLSARSTAARDREADLAAKQAEKLRVLSDARLLADDAMWRAVLDLNAEVKHRARHAPAIAERFAFLTDALRGERDAEG